MLYETNIYVRAKKWVIYVKQIKYSRFTCEVLAVCTSDNHSDSLDAHFDDEAVKNPQLIDKKPFTTSDVGEKVFHSQ